MEQVAYGVHSNHVRPAIVSALADVGQGLEKVKREEVVETLSDLLRDPWIGVNWRTAFSLGSMKASEAIPALESFSRTLSQQIRVSIERIIQGLRQADKVDGSAVKKQVEGLQDKLRLLEEQLQKLGAQVEAAAKKKTGSTKKKDKKKKGSKKKKASSD
jgi:hypothetical protein